MLDCSVSQIMKRYGGVRKDPFYANILFAVESKLHEADLLAQRRGFTLTDSAIRSLLVRAVSYDPRDRSRPPRDPVNGVLPNKVPNPRP